MGGTMGSEPHSLYSLRQIPREVRRASLVLGDDSRARWDLNYLNVGRYAPSVRRSNPSRRAPLADARGEAGTMGFEPRSLILARSLLQIQREVRRASLVLGDDSRARWDLNPRPSDVFPRRTTDGDRSPTLYPD